MRGFKVEGAEERAAAELRQLKQQFDSGAITSDVYEARRKPLLGMCVCVCLSLCLSVCVRACEH